MVKVWIVPLDVEIVDYIRNTPPIYIFPKKVYEDALNITVDHKLDNEYIHILPPIWKLDIKACQNLALRLEIEKEVENG